MIYQENTIKSTRLESPIPNRKVLMFNGYPAVEYHSYRPHLGTVFSEENRLMVVMNGTLNLTYGKSRYIVCKNQMVFLRNNTLVEYQTIGNPDSSNLIELIFFSLSYELIKEFIILSQLTPTLKNDLSEIIITDLHYNLLKFVETITPYLNESSKIDESWIKIKLLELLFGIKWCDTKILHCLLDLRKDFRPNIRSVMEDNLMNPLSISQLARLAGRSLSSFRRDFLATYNMPPSQWIRERRLKKSKELLLTTNMTVTDICYTLGFEHIAHFSRLFKSYFGHSPTKYRVG